MRTTIVIPLFLLIGCAPMQGVPSATILSKSQCDCTPVVHARVTRKACFSGGLLWYGGNAGPNHEQVITNMLREFDADAITETELTVSSFGFPLIYSRNCATVTGIPVRFRSEEASSWRGL